LVFIVARSGGVDGKHAPKAVGTYGFMDLVRHPSLFVRPPPSPSEGRADIEALHAGEARSVSCFIRGTFDPFPRGRKQGMLELSDEGASWTPFWSVKRRPIAIDRKAYDVTTRPADHREPFVKKDGRIARALATPVFVVVTCGTSAGALDFIVPSADGPLVAGYFRNESFSI
jgi:hypothetical protein